MTTFYRFPDRAAFLAAGGDNQSDYTRADRVGVSVIGERYEPEPDPLPEDYEPVAIEFLVNTTTPVEAWEQYRLPEDPANPMRIVG